MTYKIYTTKKFLIAVHSWDGIERETIHWCTKKSYIIRLGFISIAKRCNCWYK